MRHSEVSEITCPCGAKISYHKVDPPKRCVCCKKVFIKAEDVVLIEGQTPPTIVKVEPVGITGKVRGSK